MKPMRVILLASALVLVAGCARDDQVSRNAPMDATGLAVQPADVTRAETEASLNAPQTAESVAEIGPVRVVDVRVTVPRSLTVSERNMYYPSGDIVWREDPIGDRHAQVQTILADAFAQGVNGLDGPRDVILNVQLSRFHALTEKARYTIGGVHAIQFTYTLHDATTGAPLTRPKFIKADFPALGGMAAIVAEQRGVTQKVRITQHMAKVIADELSQPEGYAVIPTGVIGAINQI